MRQVRGCVWQEDKFTRQACWEQIIAAFDHADANLAAECHEARGMWQRCLDDLVALRSWKVSIEVAAHICVDEVERICMVGMQAEVDAAKARCKF